MSTLTTDPLDTWTIHPAASLFPLLDGEELDALVADIREHGLLEPVWVTENGDLLDGRNRARACAIAGVVPETRVYEGDDPIGFSVSMNMQRRHLTAGQRAGAAAKIKPLYAQQGRERQRQAGIAHGRGSTKLPADRQEAIDAASMTDGQRAAAALELAPQYAEQAKRREREATEQAAKATGASGRAVYRYERVAREAPELAAEVDAGKRSLDSAEREVKLRAHRAEAERLRATPPPKPTPTTTATYGVIEADPPWHYEGSPPKGPSLQYPTMTIDEICAMGTDIQRLAADDAFCWLWTTNTHLPDSFRVLDAWGFTYRGLFTWVKSNGFGTGPFLRNSTEHVLLGVRGKPVFLERDQRSHMEAPRGRHSEKPESFYDIIERCCKGPYVRLFARSQRDGWASWGNEA
jgi:N6-adenosine-specific RNA methylase IME4